MIPHVLLDQGNELEPFCTMFRLVSLSFVINFPYLFHVKCQLTLLPSDFLCTMSIDINFCCAMSVDIDVVSFDEKMSLDI